MRRLSRRKRRPPTWVTPDVVGEAEAVLAERIRWVEDQGFAALAQLERAGDGTVVDEVAGPQTGRIFAHETVIVWDDRRGQGPLRAFIDVFAHDAVTGQWSDELVRADVFVNPDGRIRAWPAPA